MEYNYSTERITIQCYIQRYDLNNCAVDDMLRHQMSFYLENDGK